MPPSTVTNARTTFATRTLRRCTSAAREPPTPRRSLMCASSATTRWPRESVRTVKTCSATPASSTQGVHAGLEEGGQFAHMRVFCVPGTLMRMASCWSTFSTTLWTFATCATPLLRAGGATSATPMTATCTAMPASERRTSRKGTWASHVLTQRALVCAHNLRVVHYGAQVLGTHPVPGGGLLLTRPTRARQAYGEGAADGRGTGTHGC